MRLSDGLSANDPFSVPEVAYLLASSPCFQNIIPHFVEKIKSF